MITPPSVMKSLIGSIRSLTGTNSARMTWVISRGAESPPARAGEGTASMSFGAPGPAGCAAGASPGAGSCSMMSTPLLRAEEMGTTW